MTIASWDLWPDIETFKNFLTAIIVPRPDYSLVLTAKEPTHPIRNNFAQEDVSFRRNSEIRQNTLRTRVIIFSTVREHFFFVFFYCFLIEESL